MLKVALCFFGQPRYLNNETSFISHKELLLNQDIEVDVHTHYWFDKNVKTYLTSSWSSTFSNHVPENSPEIIEYMYSPQRKLEDKPREYSFIKYNDIKEQCSNLSLYSENQFYILLSQLYSFETSIQLALDYSRDCDFEYDFIISSRYDNKILKFPDLNSLDKNKVYTSGRYASNSFVDALIIFGSKFADFKPYSNFRDATVKVDSFTVENCKKSAFELKYSINGVINHQDLDVALIRSIEDIVGQV